MIFIFTTCKNKKEAERIGLALVKKRLAACCVILPGATSIYLWQKKPVKSNEFLLLVKTFEKKRAAVERAIKKMHSYKIPFIGVVPLRGINKEYLKWMKSVIR